MKIMVSKSWFVSMDYSGYPQDGIFTIAALIFDSSSKILIDNRINEVKSKYNLPDHVEIHAKELFHKKSRDFSSLAINERISLAKDVLNILNDIDPSPIIVAVVGWGPFRTSRYDYVLDAWYVALEYLMERVAIAFNKSGSVDSTLTIFMDESSYTNDKMIEWITKNVILRGKYLSKWSVSSRIVPKPIFVNSKKETDIQLVDLVAYVIRRKVWSSKDSKKRFIMGEDLEPLYKIIEPYIDRCRDGRIEGCGIKEFRINDVRSYSRDFNGSWI